MAKKTTPAKTPAAAPSKALPAKKVADPVAAPMAAPAIVEKAPAAVEKSEVKGSGRVVKTSAPKEITYDAINQRAYEIYAGRGYAAGNPQDDWFEAERQLRAGL